MSQTTEALALPRRDPVVARIPFFYGWVMLPVAVLGQLCTSPGQTYGISAFNDRFREDLQLSHTSLTTAYMLGTLLASLSLPFFGSLMDRHGIRRVMTMVVLLFGITCMATSQVNGLITLFVAFLMLRMLGQGALSLLSGNTLSMWFDARLGTASGLMSVGAAGAFAVVPNLNLYLIGQLGWRHAYFTLGWIVWSLMLPVLWLFYRNRPEDVGQRPDGRADIQDHMSPQQAALQYRWAMDLGQAMRTRAYWLVMSNFVCWAMVGTAIIFHLVDLLAERGIARSEAGGFFAYFAGSMVLMQFTGGVLADRCGLGWLFCLSMAGMGCSVFYLLQVDGLASLSVFAIALGASQGLFMVLGQTVWARYFGRAHLGKIRGTVSTAAVAGSSLGPFVMGVVKDQVGSFAPALIAFASLNICIAVASMFIVQPQRGPLESHSQDGSRPSGSLLGEA